jgi:hypothetical protein
MRKVLILAAYFVPSNVAAVHRTRLWMRHLQEFGWEPVVLATHEKHYEEANDFELLKLVPSGVKIYRTGALPITKPRLVGDVGARSLLHQLWAARKIIRDEKIDFFHITIPVFYSALLGRIVRKLTGVPYGIDYIDPWVCDDPNAKHRFSRAWFSTKLAKILEPIALKRVSAITGITDGYYRGVLERNPKLETQAAIGWMPYGAESIDFEVADGLPLQDPLWQRDDSFHGFYAGALLPHAVEALKNFLKFLQSRFERTPELRGRFRLHFVGTGFDPKDPNSFQVLTIAREFGLGDIITEHPHRMGYLRVLKHLKYCSGVFVLGSSEPHYSPSKTFQAVQSGRPVLALLHQASTAVNYLRTYEGTSVATIDDAGGVNLNELDVGFDTWLASATQRFERPNDCIPFEQTARGSASRLAQVLDQAVQRTQR